MLANNHVNSKTGTYPAAKLEFYFENKRLPAPCFPFLIVTPEVKNLRNKILRNYQKLNGIRPALGPIRGEKEAGEEGKSSESEVMGNRIKDKKAFFFKDKNMKGRHTYSYKLSLGGTCMVSK